jgi:activator of HSP90 ATPase
MAAKQAPSSKILDQSPEIAVKSLASLIPTTTTETSKTTASSSKPRTVSITQKEKFMCTPRDLFECLVDPNRVKAYAGSDAQMSAEKGGKFKLFGGSVTGENVSVVRY